MAVVCVGEVFPCTIDVCLPHIGAGCLDGIALSLCKCLSTQTVNAFSLSTGFYFNDITGISIIEHAHVFVSSSDRLLVHADMLVDAVLVAFPLPSFNSPEHHPVHLLETQTEKTCSLSLVFSGLKRLYRFFSINHDKRELGSAQGTGTLFTLSPSR